MKEWKKFHSYDFERICISKPHEFSDFIETNRAVVLHKFNNPKKNQVALAFIPEPINTYRDKNGKINISISEDVGLCFEQELNGEIRAFIIDYNGDVFNLKKFDSPSSIKDELVLKFINYLPIVYRATHPLGKQTKIDKINWLIFKHWKSKTLTELTLIVLKMIPGIRKIVEAMTNKTS